jgi:hypothetical protein
LEITKRKKRSMLLPFQEQVLWLVFLAVVGMIQAFIRWLLLAANRSWRCQKVFTWRQQWLVVVGIIAYVGYNHLVVKQTKLFTDGSQCSWLLDLLNDP